jgi:hypothetical protein
VPETVPNESLGEHSPNRADVPGGIPRHGARGGDTVPTNRAGDPSSFIEGVEESDTPAESGKDGHHHLSENEYAERWRARQGGVGDG